MASTHGVILPHTKLFGGVRRFFELGNLFIADGVDFVVFTPDGIGPDWFTFKGKVDKISNISQYNLHALFTTEPTFLEPLKSANARLKIFYHVGPRAKLNDVLKYPEIKIFANSTNMFDLDKSKYGIKAFKALGGVNLPATVKDFTQPPTTFTIMAYGRLSRKGKGTALVVKAVERLYRKGYPVRLLLFDTPIDDLSADRINQFKTNVPFEFVLNHPVSDNESLFKKATIFVAAEKKGGWSNTAAEALACGVPLVATKTGTNDFLVHEETGLRVWRHSFFIERAIKRLIKDHTLLLKLSLNGRKKIETFSWKNLYQVIRGYIDNPST